MLLSENRVISKSTYPNHPRLEYAWRRYSLTLEAMWAAVPQNKITPPLPYRRLAVSLRKDYFNLAEQIFGPMDEANRKHLDAQNAYFLKGGPITRKLRWDILIPAIPYTHEGP